MKKTIKAIQHNYKISSILNSYSLIFFSLNPVFAFIILLVTFFSPFVGIVGLCTVVLTNFFCDLIGFRKDEIRTGLFGFNALLLGLALGYEYQPSLSFGLLLLAAIGLQMLITAGLKGVFASSNLPFLSLPFLISYWIISLAASSFGHVALDESHSYVHNEILKAETSPIYRLAHALDTLPMPLFFEIFFKTLAGTFFQSSVLGGILIAFGLLIFSRIAFSLGLIGFTFAYLFYMLFGADVNDLNYFLLGSNFIFFGIAIGCFFLIPNKYSYISVVILTPILILILISTGKLFAIFGLKAFTLSFSILTIGFLYALNQRFLQRFFLITQIQYFSAEKTIYKYLNSLIRMKNEHLYKLSLPFSGLWKVSQGYNGTITHLGDWNQALDFVIEDSNGNTYTQPGQALSDFYCYDKDVLNPYDGFVYDIVNTVEDNYIGDVDTERNWGNSIIINHLNGLFSQISHLRKDSFVVEIGQYIYKGTKVATCGNSGRSPEPHIHFQQQILPVLGSKPIGYPIGYYILQQENNIILKHSEVPTEGDVISNIRVNSLLVNSFNFYPGVKFALKNEITEGKLNWEVFADQRNRTYFYCKQSDSSAYFINDGVVFYFTDFDGDKSSLLFQFYLAFYKQLLGYYAQVLITDSVPLIHFSNWLVKPIQDFIAPFYLFTKAVFTSTFANADDQYAPQRLTINSQVESTFMSKTIRKINFEIELKDNAIDRFKIIQNKTVTSYLCIVE